MSMLTIFLGKLIGLYCIFVALAMLVNKQSLITAVNSLVRCPPLVFFVSVVGVVIGLAVVIGHNVWSGGVLPLVITLVGWAALVKGLVFLLLSPGRILELYQSLHYEKFFFAYVAATFSLGVFLIVAAFNA